MSDDVLEKEDAQTEYSLPKIWVKRAHAYKTDTRLSSSSPPHTLLESLETRLRTNAVHLSGVHSIITLFVCLFVLYEALIYSCREVFFK